MGRILVRAAFVLIAAILLLVLALAFAGERIYPWLLDVAARELAGLTVRADGPVSVQWWPTSAITATALAVAPAAKQGGEATDEPSWDARFEQIRVVVGARSLLRGQLALEQVEARAARIRIGPAAAAEPPGPGVLAAVARTAVRMDDAHIEIEGHAGTAGHTIQLQRYLSGPGADGHPVIEVSGSIDGSPLSVDGRFSARTERVGDAMAFPLTASVSVPGWALTATVKGHVARPLAGRGLALDVALEVGDVARLADILGAPAALAGRLTLHTALDGDLPSPRLRHVEATLGEGGSNAFGATLDAAGISLASGEIESLKLRLSGPLSVLGGGARASAPRVSAEATVKGVRGNYMVDVSHAQLSMSAHTRVDASGTLEFASFDELDRANARLEVKAITASAAALSRELGVALPDLGPATLRGRLTGPLDSATLEDAALETGTRSALHVSATGKVGPLQLRFARQLMAKAETDLRVEVHTDDVKALTGDLPHGLAALKPWTLRTHLHSSPREWRLHDLDLTAGRPDATMVALSGNAAGHGDLASGVKAMLAGHAEHGGSADLEVALQTADAHATAALLGIAVRGLGALAGTARIRAENSGALSLQGLSLRSQGALQARLTGDIGALGELGDVNLGLSIAATPPEVVDALLDLELPLARAVSVDGTLRRDGQGVLKIGGEGRVGSSRFMLELTAQRTATVPLVKGRIHSALIHGKDFWDAVPPPDPVMAQHPGGDVGQDPLGLLGFLPGIDFILQDSRHEHTPAPRAVPADALPWSRLQMLDVDLDVHADVVKGVHVSGGPLDLRLVDRGGRLEFGPLSLAFENGELRFHGIADSNRDPPSLEIKGQTVQVPLRELAAYGRMSSAGLAGQLNADYELRAEGHSLSQLRRRLDGTMQTLVEHGRFPVQGIDLLSADLLNWATSWLGSSSEIRVPCAVLDLAIKGGVADVTTLFIKTDNSAAFGIGHIDLRNDSMDLSIKSKTSGFLRAAPTTVRVHGPVQSPEVEVVNPAAVALHYGAEVVEDMEFPPAIVLRRLFSRLPAGAPSPCQ